MDIKNNKMLQAQIYIDKDELKGMNPLYEWIMEVLIHNKISGATAYRAHLGFGSNQHMKRPNELFSFDEVPLVITFSDEDDKVLKTIEAIRKEFKGGLITTHAVTQH